MSTPPRKPMLLNIVLAVVLLGIPVYVLSYAPVVRFRVAIAERFWASDYRTGEDFLTYDVIAAGQVWSYRPVDWLIDNTPLVTPLLWWADLWGVQPEFEACYLERYERRDAAP